MASYWQVVIDSIAASRFQAPERVAAARERIGFTSRGGNIFYASQPTVQDKVEFNNSCGSTERTAAILGCFFEDRIYLYNVSNVELDGALEVTAAHEMLHAAYQRLSLLERDRIDSLIQAEYAKVKDLPMIKDLMDYYKTAEPGAELNELHSILGTTVADLSPELEDYYKRYFTDRAAIVAMNDRYNQVFSKLKERTSELQSKIDDMGSNLKSELSRYESDRVRLETDIKDFNRRADSSRFYSTAQFYSERAELERRVNELNSRRNVINAEVKRYNGYVEELNAVSVHVSELYESINGIESNQEQIQ